MVGAEVEAAHRPADGHQSVEGQPAMVEPTRSPRAARARPLGPGDSMKTGADRPLIHGACGRQGVAVEPGEVEAPEAAWGPSTNVERVDSFHADRKFRARQTLARQRASDRRYRRRRSERHEGPAGRRRSLSPRRPGAGGSPLLRSAEALAVARGRSPRVLLVAQCDASCSPASVDAFVTDGPRSVGRAATGTLASSC